MPWGRRRSPRHGPSAGQELANAAARLTKNRAQSTVRHVAIMARERDLHASPLVTPHFVASRPGPIEPVARTSQPTRYVPVPETGEPSPCVVSSPDASSREPRNPPARRLDRSLWRSAQGCRRRRGSRRSTVPPTLIYLADNSRSCLPPSSRLRETTPRELYTPTLNPSAMS